VLQGASPAMSALVALATCTELQPRHVTAIGCGRTRVRPA
jgi:hypothetical protein